MRWWPSSARGATRSSRASRGSRAFAVTRLPAPSTPFPTCARFLSARLRSRIGYCRRKRSRCSMERASVRVDRDTFASRSQLRWRTWKKPRTGSRAWSPGSSGQSGCVLPRPQPLVQLDPLHLAGRALRQLRHDLDDPRPERDGQICAGELAQALGHGGISWVARDHEGRGRFPHHLVRYADHSRLDDVRKCQQRLLEALRAHPRPSAFEEALRAAVYGQITLRINRCQISGVQPAVAERSGRFGRVLEVPARDVLSLSHDFTRLARRDRTTLLVHHAERDAGDTLADAGRPSIDLVRIEDRQARRRLRGTVHEIETHRRFRLAQLADEGYLKLPARLLEPAEVGKLHLLEARFAQEDLVVARHAGEAGAARLDHPLQHLVREQEPFIDHDRPA